METSNTRNSSKKLWPGLQRNKSDEIHSVQEERGLQVCSRHNWIPTLNQYGFIRKTQNSFRNNLIASKTNGPLSVTLNSAGLCNTSCKLCVLVLSLILKVRFILLLRYVLYALYRLYDIIANTQD